MQFRPNQMDLGKGFDTFCPMGPWIVTADEVPDSGAAGHTRRGAWRGAFCGLGVITGFENSWGPFAELDDDQEGLADIVTLRDFLVSTLPFATLRPDSAVEANGPAGSGRRALALRSVAGTSGAVYLPAGGTVTLTSTVDRPHWLDPRTGTIEVAESEEKTVVSPTTAGDDWILFWNGKDA